MNYHRSLKRQIKKTIGLTSELLEKSDVVLLLESISNYYKQSDQDRSLLDRSLQLTSEELNQRYDDIEQQLKKTAESHKELEQLLSIIDSTMEASLDGIILVDRRGIPRMFNQKAADLLCTTKSYIQNSTPEKLIKLINKVAKNPEIFKEQLSVLSKKPTSSTHTTLEMKNGLIVDIYSQPRILNDNIVGRVWNLHDVTELRKNEEMIKYRAYHDALTDLPNRTLFQDRIEHALSSSKQQNDITLFFIDLDGFKYVNDSLGHGVGDKILIQVASRLNKVISKHDTLARHGGDEFLLMLENPKTTEQITEIARKILDVIAEAFLLDEREIYISASIGITIAPKDGIKPEQLIRNADMAMYFAKAQGRNNFQFFEQSMADQSSRQLSLKSELNQALQKNQFLLYYQPKINLQTGEISGAEALIRWQKDQNTIVAPGEFISVAEQSGLIIPISEWVLDTACKQLAEWLPHLNDDFVLSINISAQHFKKNNLIRFITHTLKTHNIPSHRIELELTESVVMDDPENSIKKLETLRDMNINLSIDDFGTGYSSFNYLKNLPINIIKIDRSFIKDIEESTRDLSLVESIVNIAHTLDLKVVAEGVETQISNNLLRDINCDTAQGYLYNKPLPATQFNQCIIK